MPSCPIPPILSPSTNVSHYCPIHILSHIFKPNSTQSPKWGDIHVAALYFVVILFNAGHLYWTFNLKANPEFVAYCNNKSTSCNINVCRHVKCTKKDKQMCTLWNMLLEDKIGDKMLKPLRIETGLVNRYSILHTTNKCNSNISYNKCSFYTCPTDCDLAKCFSDCLQKSLRLNL